jgi:transmembrane sensor
MFMENPMSISDETLDRFLAGELPPAERETVSRWLAANPAAAKRIDTVLHSLRSDTSEETADVNRAWSQLQHRIESQDAEPRGVVRTRRLSVVYGGLIAAGIAFVALTGLLVTRGTRTVEPTLASVSTGTGESRKISLHDGSVITLGPRSRLQYSETPQSVKTILTGMAGFSIIHNEKRQFSVAVGNARVVDLGTEFAIQSYERDSASLVFVRSGKIGITSAGHAGVTLGPEQGAALLRNGSIARADELASQISNYEAELEGKLSFERRSIESIAQTLSNWYGVNVIVADSALRARRITAMFQKPTLTGVLDVIAETTGAKYTISGDTVVVTRRTP